MQAIQYGDRLTVFCLATDEDYPKVVGLLQLINQSVEGDRQFESAQPLIGALLNYLRPIPGLEWDLGELMKYPDILSALFLGDDSQVLSIHRFEPKDRSRKKKDNENETTLEDRPFPSSGNTRSDRIAALINGGWSVSEVRELMNWLTAQEVDEVLYSLHELQEWVGEQWLDQELLDFREKVNQAFREKGVNWYEPQNHPEAFRKVSGDDLKKLSEKYKNDDNAQP